MKYTQLQVREIIGVSQETLRYWRQALPPLQEKRGKSACFTAGDILALLLINEMVDTLGVHIAVISDVSSQLFEQCQGIKWHHLKDCFLIIDPRAKQIVPILKEEHYGASGTIISLDMSIWISNLRDCLTLDGPTQFVFPFGPMTISKRKITN